MKREILFRGKSINTGEWVEGLLYLNAARGHWQIVEFIQTPPMFNDPCGDQFNEFHDVMFDTIGQFTGLTDKNGKRIFEGDIYKRRLDKNGIFKNSGSEKWFDLWLIEWIDKSACFTTTCIGDYDSRSNKIIYKKGNQNSFSQRFNEMDEYYGNIYDNPELLKQ